MNPQYTYDAKIPAPAGHSPAPRASAGLKPNLPHCEQTGSESILTTLRRETMPQHAALEDVIDLAAALESLATYGHLLQKFLGLYATLETRIVTTPTLAHWLPDLGQRIRAPLLVADLSALGMSHNQFEVCHQFMPVSTPAEAFGCLYVLEGSTLGGQFIARQVEASLGLTSQHGCMFFSGNGRDTGKMWKSFGESLNAFAAENPGSTQTVVASAIATFTMFLKWFSSPGPIARCPE